MYNFPLIFFFFFVSELTLFCFFSVLQLFFRFLITLHSYLCITGKILCTFYSYKLSTRQFLCPHFYVLFLELQLCHKEMNFCIVRSSIFSKPIEPLVVRLFSSLYICVCIHIYIYTYIYMVFLPLCFIFFSLSYTMSFFVS